ncbi:MAG: hypothetical protein KGS60_05885, partial [Verrucomicrobia bacterium]|nr:hypothetical protein [Verrucomicrobiota bacterium]
TPQDEVPPGKKRLWVGNGLSAVSIMMTTTVKGVKRTVKRNKCSFQQMLLRTIKQDDCFLLADLDWFGKRRCREEEKGGGSHKIRD